MNETNPTELKEKLENGASLFLKVWQKGCGPCKMSEPATRRIEESGDYDQYEFIKVSSSDYPEILEITETKTLPSFFLFDSGKLKNKIEGFKGLARLKEIFSAAE